MIYKPGCLRWVVVVAVSCLAGCVSTPYGVGDITGVVTKVHDGDSLHITPKGGKRIIIRLGGIDAPEIKQAYGVDSRDMLRSLVYKREVTARCHKRDKYQRSVCVVEREGEDINVTMIRAGYAWHYKQFQAEQNLRQRREYAAAGRAARSKQLGLWRGRPIAPWEFRSLNR